MSCPERLCVSLSEIRIHVQVEVDESGSGASEEPPPRGPIRLPPPARTVGPNRPFQFPCFLPELAGITDTKNKLTDLCGD